MTDDDEPVRGEIRLADYRRVSHGLYVKKRADLTEWDEFLRDLRAIQLVLPKGAVFTHLTAAKLLGWQLPKKIEQTPFFASVRGKATCPRRPGLICSRLTNESKTSKCHGLPVDSAEEILLRAARDLGVLDLVIMIDSALRLGHLKRARMRALLESGRPGVRRLRAAYALADKKAESGAESVLRAFALIMDVPVDSQVKLHDAGGALLGIADLKIRSSPHLLEYDGEDHRTAKQHAKDLRRERGLVSAGYFRHGYTLDDLLNHSLTVMHELDRLLGRPHHLGRIRLWRGLVSESLYSEPGRARVMNRWRRQMGGFDWCGTA